MITIGDFLETYFKIRQRGVDYVLSKLSPDRNSRVKNTFNHDHINASNYWVIPQIRQKWNMLITGNPQEDYANYIVKKYLSGKSSLKMLSLGCGSGSHEIKFAQYPHFSEITGIDIAPKLIDLANTNARKNGFTNLKYRVANVYETTFNNDYYDIILFHSSLHHFDNLDILLGTRLKKALKQNSMIIIQEYVGPDRIQWTKEQLHEVNNILQSLPVKYRKRFRLNNTKTKAYRPGILRMRLSDPSEAVESSAILPVLHKHFSVMEEKALGGNFIMPLFKDIAHNFLDGTEETKNILNMIFEKEADFLRTHAPDFVFGVYHNG
jgi:ubiquinone/menaquinone biosynthesis C-methylase UbiE